MYKNLTTTEREAAEARVDKYLEVARVIFERIASDPEKYNRLLDILSLLRDGHPIEELEENNLFDIFA